ncbi:SLBB domain-containing protein [Candidatus Izemoplasma sp. B36]|uniref:SLBB domain-containing protein n=1 Tax=Candidatus Izemoplasma sp. B36 TaxID=3242468 RepID=UPI0035562771
MTFIKKYKIYIILLIGIFSIILINYEDFFQSDNISANEYSEVLITSEYSESEQEHIIVDIKGEVNVPGFYEVPSYLRVGDIIKVAGGLTENADIEEINLTSKIYDEMIIIIPSLVQNHEDNTSDALIKVIVQIKGEVLNPGVYEIYYNSRISDLIQLAGGLTESADISEINLASKVYDEMVIQIPTIEEETNIMPNQDLIKILVEIKGEVLNPGVYELYENSRIYDLINKAGGLTIEADINNINLVEILEDSQVIIVPKINDSSSVENKRIIVEIKGEVNNPGIYYMDEGLRIYHLISRAGGVTESACLESIDQAQILEDGMTIIIPSESTADEEVERKILVEIYGEVIHPGTYYILESYTLIDLIYEAGGVTTNCDLSKVDFEITLCLGATIYIPSYDDEVIENTESDLININTANLETLMTLPGIGQILAQRIIDYRAEYGSYLTIEDIMNVSGIKESIYEQIKESITV